MSRPRIRHFQPTIRLSTLVSLASLGLLLGSAACTVMPRDTANAQGAGQQGRAGGAVAVETAIAATGDLEDPIEYTGTTQPFRQVSVRSQVEGRLLDLTADVGDFVRQGEVLAQLDDRLLNTDVNQAQAQLAALEAEVAQAQADVSNAQTQVEQARVELQQRQADAARLQSLLTEGVIAQQEADQARTTALASAQALRSAQEQVRSRQQAVEAARRRVAAQQAVVSQTQERRAYTNLTAPVSGAVLERVTEPGNLVQPGNEIVKIGDFSAVKVLVQISELELANIQTGQSVQVRLDAFPDQTFSGEVARISPAADPTSRLIPVEVTIPNQGDRIGSGLLARVQFQSMAADRVVIPETALRVAGTDNETTIFVVQGEGDAAQAIARRVQLGASSNGRVEIQSGLEAGEAFVARSSRPLQDGQSVRLSILSQTQ